MQRVARGKRRQHRINFEVSSTEQRRPSDPCRCGSGPSRPGARRPDGQVRRPDHGGCTTPKVPPRLRRRGRNGTGPNYPASPFWQEGEAFPTGTVEADNMIEASGETYDLFANAFGRDSFDGSGAIMDSIFNRGDGCPNASWNGTFISFCPGLTTDEDAEIVQRADARAPPRPGWRRRNELGQDRRRGRDHPGGGALHPHGAAEQIAAGFRR
ncbi:MAG: M4 family metallopeptidase [Rhodospirillaceae bacterium]|nr:M4 family metallopeptidase [Rhodospirillaceae bacterium]